MDLNEVMAINLRRIRHGNKLTQEELAHRTGLSTRHIGAIERAEMSATLTVLAQLSEALAVDPREFLAKAHHAGSDLQEGHSGKSKHP